MSALRRLRISLNTLRTLPTRSHLITRQRFSSARFQSTSSSAQTDDTDQSLNDTLPEPSAPSAIDWSRSFHGLSTEPFPPEIATILQAPLQSDSIEIKPDGLLYLPEIKYRRILNSAFGPGGWGLAPRGETYITPSNISREYALICHGRLVSVARGEQDYFDQSKLATATEGAKSNALMRCCKDLGIASELWDPSFIREWKKEFCVEQFVEHATTKKRKKLWRRKDMSFEYPYKVVSY